MNRLQVTPVEDERPRIIRVAFDPFEVLVVVRFERRQNGDLPAAGYTYGRW